ncbi:MAG TPA: shikimate dehydrogenase [Rhizomicrobium sp.]|nr:shikimate dehydrogenase [Rhizomicrobium sp.]
MTRKAGVVGWPVTHSLSPVLHGYWLKEHGIDGSYEKIAAKPEEFAAVIDRLRKDGFTGVNITVPNKEAAFALAQNRGHAAIEAGAANLLVFRAEGIEADNTDTFGLVESLKAGVSLAGKSVVLLGAGGAARGTVLALAQLGVSTIHILNRNIARAQALAQALQPNVKARLAPGALQDWEAFAGDAALLLNSTSAGMAGNAPLELDLSALNKTAAVCDIVYNPLQTQLLKDAAARGHKTIDGLGMLMHQAVPSFEAFFGKRPEVTPGLRAELERVLRERQ